MGDWTGDIRLEGREVTGRGRIVIFNSVKVFYILKGEAFLELALEFSKEYGHQVKRSCDWASQQVSVRPTGWLNFPFRQGACWGVGVHRGV